MSALRQLKAAYEAGMSVEDIAEDQDLDITVVKAGLMQTCSKYRKDCGKEESDEDELNFTNQQLSEVNKIIFDTALAATLPDGNIDWRTRLDAAKYVRDDKKGRKEVVRQVSNGPTINVLQINEQLRAAKELKKALVEA